MKIKLLIDPDRLTLDDMIEIETMESAGGPAWGRIKVMVQRYVADEEGNYLEPERAAELVGQLSITTVMAAMAEFRAKLEALKSDAVPPATA